MADKNIHTGDFLISKTNSDEYRKGWDVVFNTIMKETEEHFEIKTNEVKKVNE